MTGGEPLLHPQFTEIVDFFHEQDISLTLETNGTLIDQKTATHLKDSNVWHISVSLDSPRAEYHDWFRGVDGAFDKAIQGVKHLVAAGLPPQVIMCPTKDNRHEIDELVQLAVDIGAGSVKFNPVNEIGRGKSIKEKGQCFNFEERLDLAHYINNELQHRVPVPLICLLPQALCTISELLNRGNNTGTCSVQHVLGILGSGEMALCGIGKTNPDLCFGILGKDDIKDVWINHPLLNEIRKGLAGDYPGICGDCIHSPRCLMNCIAQNYICNGKLISSDALCIEADKRGLFPDSRRYSYTEKPVKEIVYE